LTRKSLAGFNPRNDTYEGFRICFLHFIPLSQACLAQSHRLERRSRGDNPAGAIKLIASKGRFLAYTASARIQLRQTILEEYIPISLLVQDKSS